MKQPYTDIICSVIIITILRELAFDFEVFCKSCLCVTDNLNLSILDSLKGIDNV